MNLLHRVIRDPLGTIRRLLFKYIGGRVRYGRRNGYDAARYWRDRFKLYGRSLRGAGHEGLSEEENARMYADAARVFHDRCRAEGVDFATANILEIGCGTGFYTRLLRDAGVASYTGVDITDALFAQLRAEFPGFWFIQQDVTIDRVDGTFDVIIMIDVLEHIVQPEALSEAMANVRRCLVNSGLFIVACPTTSKGHKRFFYLRFWTREDITRHFPYHEIGAAVPFRNGELFTIRAPATRAGAQ